MVWRIGDRHLAANGRGGHQSASLLLESGLKLLWKERRPSMIVGRVTEDRVPTIQIPVAGKEWPAVIDTGFNGDLELPEALRPFLNARFRSRQPWLLASGRFSLRRSDYLCRSRVCSRRYDPHRHAFDSAVPPHHRFCRPDCLARSGCLTLSFLIHRRFHDFIKKLPWSDSGIHPDTAIR